MPIADGLTAAQKGLQAIGYMRDASADATSKMTSHPFLARVRVAPLVIAVQLIVEVCFAGDRSATNVRYA